MKLTVYNGSPRGKKSNSNRIIPWIISPEGNKKISIDEICYLNKESFHTRYVEESRSSDAFLFVIPLYVDTVPGATKSFFELMEMHKDIFSGKPVYFVVHSGFPEMIQCSLLSRYLKYFSDKIIDMDYKGTVIIGGSEAMQMAPDEAFRKLQSALKIVHKTINDKELIPENINLMINKRERLTPLRRFIFLVNPLKNFYWYFRAGRKGLRLNLKARPYA